MRIDRPVNRSVLVVRRVERVSWVETIFSLLIAHRMFNPSPGAFVWCFQVSFVQPAWLVFVRNVAKFSNSALNSSPSIPSTLAAAGFAEVVGRFDYSSPALSSSH